MNNVLITLIVLVSLTSCTSKIDDYTEQQPTFELDRYFNGKLIAWGMIQDYSKKVNRRFCVALEGQWQQDGDDRRGKLDEWFYFDDGEVSQRTWQLTKSPNGTYTGSASDVVGEASGRTEGFAFQWQYTLKVPIDGEVYEFAMDDWMYQIDKHRVVNRTYMSKFGIDVAEVTLFFDKQQPLRSCSESLPELVKSKD